MVKEYSYETDTGCLNVGFENKYRFGIGNCRGDGEFWVCVADTMQEFKNWLAENTATLNSTNYDGCNSFDFEDELVVYADDQYSKELFTIKGVVLMYRYGGAFFFVKSW